MAAGLRTAHDFISMGVSVLFAELDLVPIGERAR